MIELPAGFDDELLRYARVPAQAVLHNAPAFPIDANGHVDVPSGVVSLPRNAFRGSTTLRSIALPAGLTQIGREAFCDCSSLTSVTIPTSVREIGFGAFANCSSLTMIELPASLTSVGGRAFDGCWSLRSIELPASFGVDLLESAKGLLKDASVPAQAVFHYPPAPAPPLSNRKAQIPEGAPNVTIDVPPGATRFEVFFYP